MLDKIAGAVFIISLNLLWFASLYLASMGFIVLPCIILCMIGSFIFLAMEIKLRT